MSNDPSINADREGTLLLCRLCWEESGAVVDRWKKRAAKSGIQVQMVDCMAACDHGPSGALAAPGAWTYLLGHLKEADGDALFWGATALARSKDGLLPWDYRPARYRKIIRGRIPPIAAGQ
ncbi:hypothetical protein B7H23_10205 [Notoacmeibacter marinus]|uniref:Metal-binding protein n=1 Tax=Notoacmeibacter marinus TaxID=1876515 RepID=A0A231UX18_9HYPH|nr:DUF1636 family protein [Notoacmeibacter marinus]OXT00485.1 hypothetical protein B7H23_10205 [Notoacmeibacter marinus]